MKETPKKGFTLLEVMISLAIMAMVMATVMQTVQQTNSAVDAIHNIMETESIGPRILQLIREDIENIAVKDVTDYKIMLGKDDTLIGSGADRIDLLVNKASKTPFEAYDSPRLVHPTLLEVGYRLRQNQERSDFLELYRREDPLVDDEPFRDGAYALVYDRIVSLDIRYAREPDFDIRWEDDWDSEIEQALPFAIEIYLEVEVQPRRSAESLNIIDANRARLSYNDVIHIPEEKRWRFRHKYQQQRINQSTSSGSNPQGQAESLLNNTGMGGNAGALGGNQRDTPK